MRIFNKFKGTKGFISNWNRLLRFRYMISEKAKERCRVLSFWERHGQEATREAFRVSSRTLFRWQRALKNDSGKLESLNPKRTTPRTRRMRNAPPDLLNKIVALRLKHPRLGKDKIHSLLKENGYLGSVSTIGRLIGDLKKQNRIPIKINYSLSGKTGNLIERKPKEYKKKLRRPHGYRTLQVDTIVRFIDGMKRYVLTGVDTEKKTAFAACYTNHGSLSASDFLRRAREVLPDCPNAIQTDNGSEFALHFEAACADLKLIHFHNYPRSPKMNACVERFNRTLDEEFLRYHKPLMRDDVPRFNDTLIDWLLWYNGERPHYALGQVSPFKAMMRELKAEECQMWWTYTCH
ncbi:MAG: integrase core domain-containing protein [bacterium]|nr:integrase core domain-containing protein [bacterium]